MKILILRFSFLILVRIDLVSLRFFPFISLRFLSILVSFHLDRSILIDSLRLVSSRIIGFVSLRSFFRVQFAIVSIN